MDGRSLEVTIHPSRRVCLAVEPVSELDARRRTEGAPTSIINLDLSVTMVDLRRGSSVIDLRVSVSWTETYFQNDHRRVLRVNVDLLRFR